MDKLKQLSPFLALLILAAFVIIETFPSYHPAAGLRLPLDGDGIRTESARILADLGVDVTGLRAEAHLKYDRGLLRQTQQLFGIERSNELLRDKVAGYFWEVSWKKPEKVDLTVSTGNEGDASKQAEKVASMLKGEVYLGLDTRGNLLQLERKLPDSLALPRMSHEEAERLARSFMVKYTSIGGFLSDTAVVQSEKRIEQPRRVDYEFAWSTTSPELGNPVQAKISVAGNLISKFEAKATIPEQFLKSETESVLKIAIVIIYAFAIIGMVVAAFRRFRSFELGFRLAMIAGITTAVVFDLEIYLSMQGQVGWEMLLPLILVPPFFGGALILVWAVSESITREVWKEKFISLDLLSNGHIVHSRVGESVVRGIAIGVASFALWLVLALLADKSLGLWITQSEEPVIQIFSVPVPVLYAVGHGLTTNAFKFTILILFVVSALRKRVESPVLLIAFGALIMGVADQGHLSPLVAGIIIESVVAVVTVWTFYRYDALAAFLSLYTFSVVQETASLFVVGNPSYAVSGAVVVGVFAFLLLAALVTLSRKQEITDFDAIMPAFARHITERQHLQQELEIARSVQMSFLPKANPKMFELDIASRCAPALEVGGDYYDFIDLGEGRLGVAVGDVSGKGTQAAFFMTLTKGFLRALAEVSDSPAAVLTQVNKLFYENVDRGVFVSMVYGMFDTRGNTLTLSRAGHNPVIMRKTQAQQVQVVNPMGLALGLDQGETFSKAIQEVKISFQKGDLFVFYTDGFPEAMNKTMEEFGEERLCQTVQKYAHGTAAEIMDGVFAEMKQFVGKAKQHDDMTIVVVKVV